MITLNQVIKNLNNIAYFETATIQEFTEGQSVIITGCGAPFNGTALSIQKIEILAKQGKLS